MATCILQAGTSNFSGSFIKAHEDLIQGEKVLLQGSYPDLRYKGKSIRYFYSKKPLLKKLKKLLPQVIYHKKVTLWEETFDGIHDAVAGFMTENNIDVILAEFGFHGASIAPHAKALNIPLIVHFHGHDAHRDILIEPYKEKYKKMFDYAFKIVSVSHFMTQKLIELGAPADKIVYNPYGPRPFFYENKPEFGNTIFNVGRFTDIKAPSVTLLAFKNLLDVCADAKLVMVGTGELLESCIALAKAWKIADKVTFTGGIQHNELMPYFQKACCFIQHSVIPSYGDAEGTPNTILEASAAGLPVVSTKHAGIVDAVIHNKTGFLVNEYDADEMTKYMIQLFNDKNLCKTMGANGREHIKLNYNINSHIGKLDELIALAKK